MVHAWLDNGSTDSAGMLLRFDQLFGNGANQIPAGSTITNRPLLTVDYLPPGSNPTGAGVTVAVIDSGLLQTDGGPNRITTTRDFTTGDASPDAIAPVDGYGHGTHVGGLIGSSDSDVRGVAPGVSYVSLRVLDNQGVGQTSHVIAALQWAVAHRAQSGIDVVNLSLGHPIYEPAESDPLVQAVEGAVREGIVVVASAGNYGVHPVTGLVGYAGIASPGNAPSAITVGALKTFDTTSRADDLIADYSSRGPTWIDAYAKPDIVAPGHQLVSSADTAQTLYLLYPLSRVTINGRPHLKLSGTSMAAGVVSGSGLLMYSAIARWTSGSRCVVA